jgi:hypothetical protein
MIIRYANGQTFEAVLLSRTETTMRVAIQGYDDIVALNLVHDVWISDDCEPVQVSFSWNGRPAAPAVRADDCICSHELAARLIHLLYAGEDTLDQAALVPREHLAAALHQVV